MSELIVAKKAEIIVNKYHYENWPNETEYTNREDFTQQYYLSQRGTGWFTQPYNIYVTENTKHQTMILANGVLNAMQIENSIGPVKQGKPHQFMEMLGGVARQTEFIRLLDHPSIIRLLPSSEDVVFSLPLLETYETDLRSYLFEKPDHSLVELLEQMTQLAHGMEHMHSKNIAHGDISLKSLLVRSEPKLHVVFANFERSSKVDTASGEYNLGRKKFTFTNNFHQAPELRFPEGPSLEWLYTNATSEGDIWSFGFMLANLVHLYPETNALTKELQVNKPLSSYFIDHADSNNVAKRVAQSPLQEYMKKIKTLPLHVSYSQNEHNAYQALVKLINDATSPDPAQRPSAKEISTTLEDIVASFKKPYEGNGI